MDGWMDGWMEMQLILICVTATDSGILQSVGKTEKALKSCFRSLSIEGNVPSHTSLNITTCVGTGSR